MAGRKQKDTAIFTKKKLEQIISEISNRSLDICLKRGAKRIRLVACSAANDGKSSTINTIATACKNSMHQAAKVGVQNGHVSMKYKEYQMFKEQQLFLCDTTGMDDSSDESVFFDLMKTAIEGKFKSGDIMKLSKKEVQRNDQVQEKDAVCIIFIFSSEKMQKGLWEQSKEFKAMLRVNGYANNEGIPTAAIITKCDLIDDAVKNDITVLYDSAPIKNAKRYLHKTFSGFPENRIFPIVNYTGQQEASTEMMVQGIIPLIHIMSDIDDSLAMLK